MPAKDPRIDKYIASAAPFAQPILKHLRKLVHTAGPEIQETMKWNSPHFEHKGLLCGMAAFKNHCAFGFWKGELIFGKGGGNREAMGNLGRITTLADLPPDKTLLGYIHQAVALNDQAVAAPRAQQPKERAPLVIPPELSAALKRNKKAQAVFEKFSYSHKKEYAAWIGEAKRAETREKRLATALEWIADGKTQHWKYSNC